MEPADPQASTPGNILTQLARQVLALQLAKLKQQQQQQQHQEQQEKSGQQPLPAQAAPARAASPSAAADYVTTKFPARQSVKPWLPGGSPSSAWGRNKTKSEVGAPPARGRLSSRRCTSAPGGTKQSVCDQQQDDTICFQPAGACRTDTSPAVSPFRHRPSSSPRKSSVSPRSHPSPSTAARSPAAASRGSSNPGRFASPLREAFSTAGPMDVSTARLDSSSANGGHSSNGASPFDSISGCAGPGRLPYHEALQIAYGPPAPSVLKTHLDLTASGAKASIARQHCENNGGSGSNDASGHDSQAAPLLPRRRSSRTQPSSSQHDSGASSTAPGAAAAAAMGAALAAATAAAALMSRRAQPEPAAGSTSQELLKGYTTGYIDGRLAALRGTSSSSSTSPSHSNAPAPAAEPAQSPVARLSSSGSLTFASLGRSGSPAQLTHAPSPDDFFLQASDAISSSAPTAVAQPSSNSSATVPAAPAAAAAGHRPAIRPELVKQIAMKIVSAALASPDKLGTQAASAAAAPTADPALTDPKAAAQALLQANPGQLRSLLEQMQKVLPPQRQRSTSPTAQLPSPRLLLPTQQWQLQQQMLGCREECLPEYSVSAFDRETDTYLIPVTHIGCQTSEVFNDRPHAHQAEQSAADTPPAASALAAAETRATAAASSAFGSSDSSTAAPGPSHHTGYEAKAEDATCKAEAASGPGAGLLLVCDAPSSGFVTMHQHQQQPRVDEVLQTDDHAGHREQPAGSQLQLKQQLGVIQQQQPQPSTAAQHNVQDSSAPSAAQSTRRTQYQDLQLQVAHAFAGDAACPAVAAADGAEAVSPGKATKSSLARIEELLQAMHSRAQQQLTVAQQLQQGQTGITASTQSQQLQQQRKEEGESKHLLQPLLGQQQDHGQPQPQQLLQLLPPAPLPAIRTRVEDAGSSAAAARPSTAAAAAAAPPALESRSSLKFHVDMPLSPNGTGSLVGLQVLERLLSELHVLQSSVKRHAAVDQLELSRLDAMMAQVALLNHWLVERCSTGHPVSAQLALLQQDLQAWRSRVGADLKLQPHGPPSPPSALRPTGSWGGPSSPNSPVSPRGPYQGAPLSPRTLHLQQQWLSATATAAAPAGLGSPRMATSPGQQRQQQQQQPQQQLLAPILSGGLMRSRSMPIHNAHSWPPGALPPVQEGRESECDTASSVGDVSSVHSMQSSIGTSLAGRSSAGSGSISLVLKPQQRGSPSIKPKSILASVDVGGNQGCEERRRSSGSSGGNRRRSSSGGGTGSTQGKDHGQGMQGSAPCTARQHAHEHQSSSGLGFLKPSGWLSPRSRAASMEQPQPTQGPGALTRSSVDALRGPRSPRKAPLATRSMGFEPGGQPALQASPIRGSGSGNSSGGGGSPSSVKEKKRGFLLALKQTLQENMQHLGGKKAAPAGRWSGGSGRVNARQLTAEALQIVAQHER